MGWGNLAYELWDQSAQLNAERDDHPLCGGAVSRLGARGETSCQYALYLLRWLRKAPEEFLTGPALDVGDVRLPDPGRMLGLPGALARPLGRRLHLVNEAMDRAAERFGPGRARTRRLPSTIAGAGFPPQPVRCLSRQAETR